MKKYTVHIVWALIVIVGFIGGLEYGKTMASAGTGGRAGFAGAFGASSTRAGFGGRAGVAGGGFTAGTITAMDSQSITLQLPNGNSEVVFYSTSTSVSEPTTVPLNTLKTGTMVTVGGTQNSDGSLTASTIQVRPAGSPGFGGAPGGAGRGSATSTSGQ